MNDQTKLLARAVLEHLKLEEELLDQMNLTADRMGLELHSRYQNVVNDLSDDSNDMIEAAQETAASRRRMKAKIARHFRIPVEQSTALTLAERCDKETGTEIRHHCDRLESKATKLNTVSRENNALAGRLGQLLEQVLRTLSGEPCLPPLYGRDGHRRAA